MSPGAIQGADLQDFRAFQLGGVVEFASSGQLGVPAPWVVQAALGPMPTSLLSVHDIVGRRPQLEMVRPATPRVVAAMTDEKTVRDLAERQFVGEPVSANATATDL